MSVPLPSTLEIREAGAHELEPLLELYEHFDREDDSSPEAIADAWQQMRDQPGLHVYVGVHHSRFVASCMLVVSPHLRRGPRPFGLIENVVAHSDFRRRGFGTTVVRHAIEAAWSMDCYKVMLFTGRTDEAIMRFYEGAGLQRGLKTGFLATSPKDTDG